MGGAVLFADICKEEETPLGSIAASLHGDGVIGGNGGQRWKVVGAARAYNPLGCTVTFLDERDIMDGVFDLLS